MSCAPIKLTEQTWPFNCYLQHAVSYEGLLYFLIPINKLKMYGTIDRKHQRSFENSYRLAVRVFNQLISKPNYVRFPNCVPSLASRLSGENNIAVSNICSRLGSGVSA